MEIKRQQEIVEAYHYDMRVPDSEVETDLRVSFSPIEVEEENYPVERLSYEVTEIALDRPGVQLNFQQSEEA